MPPFGRGRAPDATGVHFCKTDCSAIGRSISACGRPAALGIIVTTAVNQDSGNCPSSKPSRNNSTLCAPMFLRYTIHSETDFPAGLEMQFQ